MENTVAFGVLMELISVLGSFVTTPMFFGLSVINILVISFIFTYVIGICLGGISLRVNVTRDNIRQSTSDSNYDHFVEMEKKGIDWHSGKKDPSLR